MMIDSYDRSGNILNSGSNSCTREEFSFKTSSSSLVADHKVDGIRKIICRYGRGCTHMHDTCHRSKFWHPPMPALTGKFANSLWMTSFFPIIKYISNNGRHCCVQSSNIIFWSTAQCRFGNHTETLVKFSKRPFIFVIVPHLHLLNYFALIIFIHLTNSSLPIVCA